MVEYNYNLNCIFDSLADRTRRDILIRVKDEELTISQIASEYDMSVAAVSKHVKILESAGLVSKRHEGRKRLVSFVPESIAVIRHFIEDL